MLATADGRSLSNVDARGRYSPTTVDIAAKLASLRLAISEGNLSLCERIADSGSSNPIIINIIAMKPSTIEIRLPGINA